MFSKDARSFEDDIVSGFSNSKDCDEDHGEERNNHDSGKACSDGLFITD